jgi:bifunctional DNase/RNase
MAIPSRQVRKLLVLLALNCWLTTTSARELAADIEQMVSVEIATIGVAAFSHSPVVLLREPHAREVIPIFIGTNEANAILRAMHGIDTPRPLTHELLGTVIQGLDATLERVYVDDLVDNTFLGMLEFRVAGREQPLRIDSRPSDALALALRTGASIHVAPKVLEAARQIEYEGLDDQIVTAVGITVNPLTDDLRIALDLPDELGVLVSHVTGPAQKAGMEPGALLLTVNGETPRSPLDFLERVRQTPTEQDVQIRYWQAGDIIELELPTDVPSPQSRRQRRSEQGMAL